MTTHESPEIPSFEVAPEGVEYFIDIAVKNLLANDEIQRNIALFYLIPPEVRQEIRLSEEARAAKLTESAQLIALVLDKVIPLSDGSSWQFEINDRRLQSNAN